MGLTGISHPFKRLLNKQRRTQAQASRAAVRGANLLGVPRRHWNYRKYGAIKLNFTHAKEFLRKSFATWAWALKHFRKPYPRSKKFKKYRF